MMIRMMRYDGLLDRENNRPMRDGQRACHKCPAYGGRIGREVVLACLSSWKRRERGREGVRLDGRVAVGRGRYVPYLGRQLPSTTTHGRGLLYSFSLSLSLHFPPRSSSTSPSPSLPFPLRRFDRVLQLSPSNPDALPISRALSVRAP